MRLTRTIVFTSVGLALALGGCAKTSESPKATETARKASADKADKGADEAKKSGDKVAVELPKTGGAAAAKKPEPPPEKKVELPPETPEQIAAQCQRILEKGWKAVQPAMAKLQIPDAASYEKKYLETGYDTRKFLEACPKVARKDRDCVEKAEHPATGVNACKVEEAKNKMRLPRLEGGDKSPLFAVKARPPADAAKITKQLKGVWVNKSPFGEDTWTIDAAGKVVVERKGSDGKVKKKTPRDDFTLTFPNALQSSRKYAGNSQTITFFMPDPGTFYASGNLDFAAWNMNDGKNFVAKHNQHWVLVEDGACTVVTIYGMVVSAKCGVTDHDGKKYFAIEYQVPGKTRWKSDQLQPTKDSFLVVANHAIHSKMVKLGSFTKKP